MAQPMLKWIPTQLLKNQPKMLGWVGLEGISFISLMGWMHILVIPFYCCLPIYERTPLWLMFTLKQNDNILSCCVLKTTTSYMDCVWFVKLWFKKAYYAINRRQDRHVLKYWLCCKSWLILIHSRRSFFFFLRIKTRIYY